MLQYRSVYTRISFSELWFLLIWWKTLEKETVTLKLYKFKICASSKAFVPRNKELTFCSAKPGGHTWAASSALIYFHVWLKFSRWKGRSRQDSEDWNTCTCTSMRFCIDFFAIWQSSRSIWKSQYLAVIEDQWSKCRNSSAYFLVKLLSCGQAIRWMFQDSSKKSVFRNSV